MKTYTAKTVYTITKETRFTFLSDADPGSLEFSNDMANAEVSAIFGANPGLKDFADEVEIFENSYELSN